MDLLRLDKNHVQSAAGALAAAFFDDPFVKRICPDESTRVRAVLPVFRFSLGLAVKSGEAWATSQELEGVALWLYSWKMGCPPWRWLLLGGLGIRRNLSPEGHRELSRVSERIDRERDAVAPARFLYLSCLGVRPEHRRKGLATALVLNRVRRAADEGLSTVVETNTPEALSFYRSAGFEVRSAFRAADLDYYVLEHAANPEPPERQGQP